MEDYNYLLYVTEYDYFSNQLETHIYKVKTDDIYHTIGEFYFRSFVRVARIQFVKYTEQRIDYWKQQGNKIYEFRNKYRSFELNVIGKTIYELEKMSKKVNDIMIDECSQHICECCYYADEENNCCTNQLTRLLIQQAIDKTIKDLL